MRIVEERRGDGGAPLLHAMGDAHQARAARQRDRRRRPRLRAATAIVTSGDEPGVGGQLGRARRRWRRRRVTPGGSHTTAASSAALVAYGADFRPRRHEPLRDVADAQGRGGPSGACLRRSGDAENDRDQHADAEQVAGCERHTSGDLAAPQARRMPRSPRRDDRLGGTFARPSSRRCRECGHPARSGGTARLTSCGIGCAARSWTDLFPFP